MSYPKEFAHKLAHCPLVANQEVRRTVAGCAAAPAATSRTGSPAEFRAVEPARDLPGDLRIVATDGSRWELKLDRQKHRLGYLQIGMVQFTLDQYASLDQARVVNPFASAQLLQQRQVWGLSLPSSHVYWQDCASVRDSVRVLFDRFLAQTRPIHPDYSLRDTLFGLAAERPGPLATGDDRFLRLHKCPDCSQGPVVVARHLDDSLCSHCGARLYASDCLRVYEEVRETQSNEKAFTRLMLVLEHLFLIHHLEVMAASQPALLAQSVWFMDGPLALFGPASWLHAPIQVRLHEISKQLRTAGRGSLNIVGVEKTGRLVKHARFLRHHMPRGSVFPVNDEYRYQNVVLSRAPNKSGFGSQTHYGQDFVYHSAKGPEFVFSLPYPAPRKTSPVFDQEKIQIEQYGQLPRVTALLERLSSNRFPSTIVPTLLAHQVTAISRQPGSDVLQLFSKSLIRKPKK